MAELKEKIIEETDNKPYLWWRYIDDIFFIWEHGEEKSRNFVETLNKIHPTIKFFAESLDVTVSLKYDQIDTLTIVRKAFGIVKHY